MTAAEPLLNEGCWNFTRGGRIGRSFEDIFSHCLTDISTSSFLSILTILTQMFWSLFLIYLDPVRCCKQAQSDLRMNNTEMLTARKKTAVKYLYLDIILSNHF